MYDVKIYQDGRERETIRGLTLAQASALQSFLDRNGVRHTVKRLTPVAAEAASVTTSEGDDTNRRPAEHDG